MKNGVQILRSLGFVFAVISLLAFVAVSALGQGIDGAVVGTVTDSTGAAVVGATVSVTELSTNRLLTTKTSSTGDYRIEHLQAGTYKINAQMTGFKSISEQVDVELNKISTRNLTLTPGATTETVEVSGVPPTLDTTTAQVQTTFDQRELQDLPLTSQGSGVINLSLLDAGVASSGGIGVGTGPSISGQRPRNNNYTIEGVDNNSKSVTGPLMQLPNDAVDQFTVLQNQFSPEFGHSSGGQFNQTIKSGTNSFHGRAYEYFQNRNLNAEDSQTALGQVAQGLTPSNPRYDNNRFGGQLGGPIIRNKLFFFTNWEYNPIGQDTASTGCAPTAAGYAMLATDATLSQTNVSQFQKYVGAALAPAGGGAGDANCGGSSAIGVNAAVPIGDVGYSGALYNNTLNGLVSIDWNISAKDQVRGRYSYSKNNAIDTAAQIPFFWLIVPARGSLVTLSEYHTFAPNLNNEVRVGFNHNGSTLPAGSFQFPGLNTFPNFNIGFFEGNGIQIGADGNAPQFGYQGFLQFVDNISWVKGRHNFKFGGEYRQYIAPQGFTQRSRGEYDYTSFNQYFTDGVPDYLAERSIGDLTYYGNQKMFYWFANDDFHLRKNLSLNLGIRYEYTQTPLSERQWQPLNAISSVPGLITFGAPKNQTTNYLPRIGLAWSPGSSGTTSIRAGYSMAVDVLYDNLGLLSAPPQVQQTCDASSNPSAGAAGLSTSPTCHWSDPANPASGVGFLAGGGLPFAATVPPISDPAVARLSTAGYIPDQKLPYSETWTLGVQHIFQNKYTVEVRYVGTRGIHLPVQQRINRQAKTSSNDFLPTFFTAPSQATIDALTTTYSQINANSNYVPAYANVACTAVDAGLASCGFSGSSVVGFMPWGSSNYNGLQTQVTRSLTNGLQFQVAYTWSHALDNSTADVFSTYLTPRRPQDFQCFQCDYSDSALDRRHRLTMQFLYDVPFLKHSDSWLKRNVIGNWEFAPIYTYQSPEKVTVQSGRDVNGNGDSAGDRVFINPGGTPGTGADSVALCNSSLPSGTACGSSASRPFLVAYEADPKVSNPYYVAGGIFSRPNARRNTLPMPVISNLDLTAAKRFNISETQSFEFQMQSLNVLNHAQYLPGNISDVAPLGYTGTNVLGMLEPYSPSFNNPKAIFSNHPRGLVLVMKYNF